MKMAVSFQEINKSFKATFGEVQIVSGGGGGSTEDLDDVLDAQDGLIDQLKDILANKASGGKVAVIEPLAVTANGEYTASDGVDGYSPVVVSVPVPDGYIKPSGSLDIAENGTHDVTEYAAVNVNVPTGGADENVLATLIDRTITAVTVPSGVKTIGANAFMSCSKLVDVSLPAELVRIESSAFQSCASLTELSLPDSVTSIGGNAFMGCSKLVLTHLPSSLTSVGTTAFRTCTALESITFHSTPTVGANAFFGCSKLRDIYVPWAEGEVANAPWGATNATIHYNSDV